MKTKSTNIAIIALTTMSVIPFAGANLDNTTTSSDNKYITTSNTTSNYDASYTSYYEEFKKEFFEELSKGDFTRLEEKLKGYLGDIDYLSQNTDSEHYANIQAYKTKAQVLKDLKQNFGYMDNMPNPVLDNSINYDKIKAEKEELMKKMEAEKKRLEEQKKQKQDELNKQKELQKQKQEEQKKLIEQKRNELKENVEAKKEIISNFKDKKQELREKYKTQFKNILKNRIETMKETHIKTVLSRIEKALEKTTNEKIIAQLEALKELFEARLTETEEVIDIEELLKE